MNTMRKRRWEWMDHVLKKLYENFVHYTTYEREAIFTLDLYTLTEDCEKWKINL